MKRILLLSFVWLMAIGVAWAQQAVTGTVVSKTDGEPLPGVAVRVQNTSTGVVTDMDGKYRVEVPSGDAVLQFSYIGYLDQTIPVQNKSVIDVSLAEDVETLGEVVVTAMGIERNRNELAYSAQKVTSEQITRTRSSDFVNTLSGKVAGLNVQTNNTMGGSTNVIIRGYSSITGNNQALFVIDGVPVSNANNNTTTQQAGGVGTDYGNAAGDLNPDNIESVNVLKGAAATALYGSRAANGVIMITTKKGKKDSFNVTVNSGVTWGTIDKSTYARYQKEYGGGYFPAFSRVDLGSGRDRSVIFTHDASYGPAFNPDLMVYQWDAVDPSHPNFGKMTPWDAAVNDPTTFFETAVNSNQNIMVTGGGARSTFKLGYTRNDEKGVLPNSNIDKNLFNFSASYDLTKRITVDASANYSLIKGLGRYGTGYNGRNPNQQFRQWWQTNVDIKEQEEAYWRNEQNITWNWNSQRTGPIYSDNPYWTRYQNYSNDTRNNVYGYASVNYKIADWVSVMGRAAFNTTNDMQEERVAVGSADVSEYERFNREFTEANYDLFVNFNKPISEDISFNGLIGSNLRRSSVNSVRAETNGGLVVPGLYSLSNSLNPIEPPFERYERVGVDGIFANANFGFKETVFLELSARQDKSTTLPEDENTYFYPAIASNFVFSNVVDLPWLQLGKIRANYAEVGSDASALSVYDVYFKPTGYGSTPLFSVPSTKNNANLRSERTKSIEGGIELEMFKGIFGVDITAYQSNTIDQIIPVSVTAATGYTRMYVNAGEVQNRGIEVAAFVVPVQTQDLTWTMNVNFSRNRSEVLSLFGEGDAAVKNVPIQSFQGGVSTNAAVGYPYGVIRGTDFVYTNGERTVNELGYYMSSGNAADIIGDPNPDWIGGVNNSINYKGLGLSFLVDVRKGGDVWSLDQWYGEATGLYPHTAGLNDKGNPSRLPVAEGGGILLSGVQEDGSPNTVYAENLNGDGETPFGYAANLYEGAPRAMYLYDGSFVKLREVALTYSLPKSLFNSVGAIKGVDVSLIGRNLWIIHKNMEFADPEEGVSSGNSRGYQTGAYPAVRTYGFNVRLNF